jgi:hypothetical protein
MWINRGLSQSGKDMQQQAGRTNNFCQPGRLGINAEIFHAIIIAPIPKSPPAKSVADL